MAQLRTPSELPYQPGPLLEFLAEQAFGAGSFAFALSKADVVVVASVVTVGGGFIRLDASVQDDPLWRGRYKRELDGPTLIVGKASIHVTTLLSGRVSGEVQSATWSEVESGMAGAYPSIQPKQAGVMLLRTAGADLVERAIAHHDPATHLLSGPDGIAFVPDPSGRLARSIARVVPHRTHQQSGTTGALVDALLTADATTAWLAAALLIKTNAQEQVTAATQRLDATSWRGLLCRITLAQLGCTAASLVGLSLDAVSAATLATFQVERRSNPVDGATGLFAKRDAFLFGMGEELAS